MKLIIQNSFTNEFLPGCEFTVVDIDKGLTGVITARGKAFRRLMVGDSSLWQARYWDWRPVCINSFESLDAVVPAEGGSFFEEWIERNDGWVVVEDLAIPEAAVVRTDCQTMTIGVNGKEIEIGWVFNLKDSPDVIRTAAVNFSKLKARIR